MTTYIKAVATIVQAIFAVVGIGFFSILIPEIVRLTNINASLELRENYFVGVVAAVVIIGGIGLTEIVKRRLSNRY